MRPMLLLAVLCAFAAPARAVPINVSYSTAAVGPFAFHADFLSESGQSGSLSLDTSLSTTNVINLATLSVGDSGPTTDSTPVNLSFALTLDGVTHTLTQTGTWNISPTQDSVLAVAASGPVLFATPSGSWQVSLGSWSIVATNLGNFNSSVAASFAPVPEPGSIGLFSIGMLVAGGMVARFKQADAGR